MPVNLISPFIKSQLPRTIQDNYPLYVEFIKSYYEWLEQPNNTYELALNLATYADIDTALSVFLDNFKNTYLVNIPENILVNKPFLIKHIREFYQEKGSENSYKFLFKVLFNVEVNFYYPIQDMLRVSSGEWIVKKSIRTTTTTNTFKLIGQTIKGLSSGSSAIVDDVTQFYLNGLLVSEIFLTNISGTFLVGEAISNIAKTIRETTYGLLIGAKVVLPGNNYQINDPIIVTDATGVGCIVQVDKLVGNEYGIISNLVAPTAQSVVLGIHANNTLNNYIGAKITILDGPAANVSGYISGETYPGISTQVIFTAPASSPNALPYNHYRIDLGQVFSVKVLDPGVNYSKAALFTVNPSGSNSFGYSLSPSCFLSPIIGALFQYPGYWKSAEGFLNDVPKIQDDDYYQIYSYVLKSPVSLNNYEMVVNNLVHPAGTKLFGEVHTEQEFYVGVSLNSLDKSKLFFNRQTISTLDYNPPVDLFFANLRQNDFCMYPAEKTNINIESVVVTSDSFVSAGDGVLINNEVPLGTINGINTNFSLAGIPNPTGSLILSKNGQILFQGVGYTLAGYIISFNVGYIPQNNDLLRAWYQMV